MSAAEAVANLEWIATRGQIGAIERIVAQVSGYIVVQDGLIVLANDTAEKLLGCDNLPGTPLNAVLPANVRSEHAGWMKDWEDAGAPVRLMGKNGGHSLDFTITISPATWNDQPAQLAVMLPSYPVAPCPIH